MLELKHINPLSDWIDLRIDTRQLPGPEETMIRVRVKPVTDMGAMDALYDGARRMSEIALSQALDAIGEWDLMLDGKPLPCTEDVKREYGPHLKILLAQPLVEDTPPVEDELRIPRFVAMEICKAGRDYKSFLKN